MEGLSEKLFSWLAALWPAIQQLVEAVAALFRRLMLGLFGGVPSEDRHRQQASADEESGRAPEPSTVPPRWSDRLVRDALALTVAGRSLRSLHRERLPAPVLEWLAAVEPEQADELRRLPPHDLKLDFQLWEIGGEVLDADRNKPNDDPDQAPAPNNQPTL